MKKRNLTSLLVFVFLAAACGQYSGVHEQGVASGEAAGGGAGLAPAGTTLPDGTILPDGTTAAGAGTAGTGSTGSTGTTSTSPGTAGSATSPTGTTTGVTANLITYGLHAPLTGAAPISPVSFNTGRKLYWENANNGKAVEIHGRRVEVVFEDDQYNPSHAQQVCKKMAEQDEVFNLIGGGGTDQIQACANYAASRDIPYLSAGVTEVGIAHPEYFAVSMTYKQQVPLLVNYIKKTLGFKDASRVAMVATDTPFFDDSVNEFTRLFPGVRVFRHSKNEDGASMAQNLCTASQKKFDVVFPLVAPLYYLEMAGAAGCRPQYAGVGITMGLDTVANNGCRSGRSTENARFFSPAPAFADSDKYDKRFRQAGGADDIMFLLWGLSATLHQLYEKAGPNLTREGFLAATSQASVETGVYPDLQYSPTNHFGAHQVNILKNVCTGSGGHYVTERAFVSSI